MGYLLLSQQPKLRCVVESNFALHLHISRGVIDNQDCRAREAHVVAVGAEVFSFELDQRVGGSLRRILGIDWQERLNSKTDSINEDERVKIKRTSERVFPMHTLSTNFGSSNRKK